MCSKFNRFPPLAGEFNRKKKDAVNGKEKFLKALKTLQDVD